MTRRRLAGLAGLAAGLALPATAHGHAILERTEPARGAALAHPPDSVALGFNEPVEASFGAVRVYDRDGERVDAGGLERPAGSETLAVPLAPQLEDGIYTATYRVVSADSHPVSGGFTFTVGDPPRGSDVAVADLIEESDAGPVTQTALGAARWLALLATAALVGGLVFLTFTWAPALRATAGGDETWRDAATRFAARLRRLLALGVAAGIVAGAAGIVLQGAVALGVSFWDALRPAVVGEVLSTRFGVVWGARLLDMLLLAGLLFLPPAAVRFDSLVPARLGAAGNAAASPLPASRVATAALGLALGFLALVPALAGHARVTDPIAPMIGANFAHVLAFAIWAGGLLAFAFAVPRATRTLAAGDRTRLLAALVDRFSALALPAVAVLLAAGIAQSIAQLESFADLFESGYGRAIAVKALLLVALIGLGALNRRRFGPRLRTLARDGDPPGRPGAGLRASIRAELALIGGALAATAVLAALAPPAASQAGPYSASAELGGARLELTVDPALAGANEVHAYLFDRTTGAQWDEAKEVEIAARLPAERIGPLELEVRKAGPGHYLVRDAALGVAGEWELELRARVSAFDEYRTTLEVPVE